MKITQQENHFAPITIVIETAEEAEVLWAAIRCFRASDPSDKQRLIEMSDWFSNHAKL